MKIYKNIFALSVCAIILMAQNADAKTGRLDSLCYHDAAKFEILGKVYQDSLPVFSRIPQFKKDSVRKELWNLGRNSAGVAVRFRSNAKTIAACWTAMFNNSMNHMTATGIKGLDLYGLVNGNWRFVRSARPVGKKNRTVIVDNMNGDCREYMLYLSLYDGVDSLYIGVDSAAFITSPVVNLPDRSRPVAFYGSSIMQGGCASRPGMAGSNIIGRRLNVETVNLGFSGNAFIDYSIARIMADVDASVYVLDYVPNASPRQIRELTEGFVKILRDKRPDVPIVFVEDPDFSHHLFDSAIQKEIDDKNSAITEMFYKLKAKGIKNIYFVDGSTLMGEDGESTVDGFHCTDLGFMQYADALTPLIKKLIHK